MSHNLTHSDLATIADYMFDNNNEVTIGFDAQTMEQCFIVERIVSKTGEPFYNVVSIHELKNIDLIMKQKGTIPMEWLVSMYIDKQPVRNI